MILLLLIIAVLMATPAAAQPRDLWEFQQWIWPRKGAPVQPPAPLPKEEPLPQVPIEDIPIPLVVPEPLPAPVVVAPAPVQPTQPKPKPRPRPADDDDDERPARKPRAKSDSGADISCADVRQALGMPCFLIRSNAHIYENYTPKQKRQAQDCLTAAERKSIQDCFKTKPGARQ